MARAKASLMSFAMGGKPATLARRMDLILCPLETMAGDV